jgi:hypothetical protein
MVKTLPLRKDELRIRPEERKKTGHFSRGAARHFPVVEFAKEPRSPKGSPDPEPALQDGCRLEGPALIAGVKNGHPLPRQKRGGILGIPHSLGKESKPSMALKEAEAIHLGPTMSDEKEPKVAHRAENSKVPGALAQPRRRDPSVVLRRRSYRRVADTDSNPAM